MLAVLCSLFTLAAGTITYAGKGEHVKYAGVYGKMTRQQQEEFSRLQDSVQDTIFGAAGDVPSAGNIGLPGTPLPQPIEYRSVNGVLDVTMNVSVSRLEGPISFNRRSFNGKPTGPTLRVKPGDKLKILLHNQLGTEEVNAWGKFFLKLQQRPTNGNWYHDYDVYSYPNVTNLHLHGSHLDPTGISDNVQRACKAGEKMQWVYDFPLDHPRGTFWYHPHFEGSSAIQVASGMVGALIVEDDPDTMPPEIAAMKDLVLVLHEVSHSEILDGPNRNVICFFCIDNFAWPAGDRLPFNKTYNDPILRKCGAKLNLTGFGQPYDCEYLLINGEYQPTIAMQPGEYQRWRIVQSSHSAALRFAMPGCQVLLLARDGLYLSAPVNFTDQAMVITAGSRADIAIRCMNPGEYNMNSLTGGYHNSTTVHITPPLFEPYQPVVYPRVVLTAVVSGEAKVMRDPVKTPPNGRQDLRKVPVAQRRTIEYNLTGFGGEAPFAKPVPYAILNGGTFMINNHSYTGRPEICMEKGTVEEWQIVSLRNPLEKWMHSFHIHVNPFQVVAMDYGDVPGQKVLESKSMIGEWADTVQVPAGGSVTIRMKLEDYTGTFPFHCHVVTHQGIGMMMLVEVKEKCP